MAEEAEIEETLDKDYLFLISFAKTYYPYVVSERDRVLCDQWLLKLCSENVQGISAKRNRNTFLAYFLMNLQELKMTGPFSKPPDDGPLPQARAIFAAPEAEESAISEEEEEVEEDYGKEPEEFQERSADGRTYVAVRCLPNNQGTYAFVALNLDKGDDDSKDAMIVPCSSDQSKLRHLRALTRLANGKNLGNNPSESQMEDFYIRNIDTTASGDISQLFRTLHSSVGKPCGRNESEIAYYDVLLNQIDEEIKGSVTSENELVRFLVCRLSKDLKRVPKMQHLFALAPEQRHLKLLEILRQKLVVRQQEEKRRNLLTEMEEMMTSFGTRSECCMGRSDVPTESMWQLAVTRPLADSVLKNLGETYPENAIATFLDLLADDRQLILERGQKRQKREIDSMRSEVYKEVQAGKAEYNKARAAYREWNEILSIVEEILYEASNQNPQADCDEEEPSLDDCLLMNMIANIKETKNLVIEEARRAEMLTEKIADANTWTFSIQNDNGRDSSWEIKSTIENTRREIETLKMQIQKQNEGIHKLRGKLAYE